MTRSILIAAALASALSAGSLAAQSTAQPDAAAQTGKWDFLVTGGRMVPTGAQRETLEGGGLTAAQLSYAVHPILAVTTTVGWTRSRDVASPDTPKLDVFSYDLGVEARGPRFTVHPMLSVAPFAGLGGGARSYNYRSLAVDATHNVAAYGSVGAEIGLGPVGLRLEARDYVTGFKPLAGEGATDTRNDVALMGGLRIKLR